MIEEWRSINGFDDTYWVSNLGRVKGNKGILVLKPRKDGYIQVNLFKSGKYITKLVHRLVAETFIPNPDNLPQIDHIDANRFNNTVINLKWCTASENNCNPVTVLRKREANLGSNNPMYGKASSMRGITKSNHFNSKRVVKCSLDGVELEEYNSLIEASESVNASPSTISNCIAGRIKTCKGYTWRWKI
jgi:hypothetical protein|nr:MAG TPA: homing endonuclease [Crassvirales sp.]